MSNTKQYSASKLAEFKIIIEDLLKKTNKELASYNENQEGQKERLANTNVYFNQTSKHFQQQAKNKELINRLEEKSKELESALDRIENKVYGVCDRTGELIQEARLIAKPTARFDILSK